MREVSVNKKVIVNLGLVLMLIVVFSHWWFQSKTMSIWGMAIILALALIFFYNNVKNTGRSKDEQKQPSDQLLTPQDYIYALSACRNKEEYKEDIDAIIGQTNRFVKKENVLFQLLYTYFKKDDTFFSLTEVVNQEENKLFLNIQRVLSLIESEDKEESGVASLRNQNEVMITEFEDLFQKVVRINISDGPNELSEVKDSIEELKQIV